MIDLHCHILPGIDDGAKNLDDVREMLASAKADGISKIVATPHNMEDGIGIVSPFVINSLVKRVNDISQSEGYGIEVFPGSEAYISTDLPRLVKNKRILTINGTQYLLVEFPVLKMPEFAVDIIYQLRLMGITPIIAHPERYAAVVDNPDVLLEFIRIGALCQVNSGSITGIFGKMVKKTAEMLLQRKMVHIVSTDAHPGSSRMPRMKEAYEFVADKLGRDYSNEVFIENPAKIIKGREIEIRQPEKVERRTLLYNLLASFGLL